MSSNRSTYSGRLTHQAMPPTSATTPTKAAAREMSCRRVSEAPSAFSRLRRDSNVGMGSVPDPVGPAGAGAASHRHAHHFLVRLQQLVAHLHRELQRHLGAL